MNQPQLEKVQAWLTTEKKLYIGGEWVVPKAKKLLQAYDPSTIAVIGRFYEAGGSEVDSAVSSARQAFKGPWRGIKRAERAASLKKFAQVIRDNAAELATLESFNNGKTFVEAFGDDLPESADVLDYYAGWIDKNYGESNPVEQGFISFTKRDPIGVCALVVPWNFPLLLACWKMAPALAMGNTIVVKPSPFTSLSMIRLVELVHEARIFPPGVLNLILGGNETGEAISLHSGIDKISFTGSTNVGKKVVQGSGASNLKSVTLELGGKSPNIIFDDAADLDAVIQRSFTAMFSHKGEKCSEPTRLLVQQGIYDKVTTQLAAKADAVRCGNPFDSRTTQGPQCHEAHYQKVLSYLEIGKKEGAKVLAGGTADLAAGKGYFVRPTLFGGVNNKMRIAQEEIFGPVLCVIPFATESDAIEIANDTPYGLAAGLYTSDLSRGHRVADQLEAGMVFVNHYGCYDFASPFGGIKQSGWGREMAKASLDSYTKARTIWVRYQ